MIALIKVGKKGVTEIHIPKSLVSCQTHSAKRNAACDHGKIY